MYAAERQRFYYSASDPTICFRLSSDIYVGLETTEHVGTATQDRRLPCAQLRAGLHFKWKLLSAVRTNKRNNQIMRTPLFKRKCKCLLAFFSLTATIGAIPSEVSIVFICNDKEETINGLSHSFIYSHI